MNLIFEKKIIYLICDIEFHDNVSRNLIKELLKNFVWILKWITHGVNRIQYFKFKTKTWNLDLAAAVNRKTIQYFLNSFLFFLFFFLVFIASLVCITLVKFSKFSLYNSTLSFSYIFDFFRNISSFDFLRKQNMYYQNKRKPVSKLVRFTKLNVAEE